MRPELHEAETNYYETEAN